MDLRKLAFFGIAALCTAAFATSQARPSVESAKAVSAVATELVPIHTGADDPVGGRYGYWAVGQGYKVSFHEGFKFYPWLGKEYKEHLPFAWRTASIKVGGHDAYALVDEPRQRKASDWRYEYALGGGVVEAYDVRKEGVEQTFVLARPPAQRGDLVVSGVVTTPLLAEEAKFAHQELCFMGPKRKRGVTYGKAYAFDAVGQRINVETAYDGRQIKLRVPGPWLAKAVYPVTIDPLTSPVLLSLSFSPGHGPVVDSDCHVYGTSPNYQQLCVVHSRRWTATDLDSYAHTMDLGFANRRFVWAEINASWSTRRASSVGKWNSQWTIVMERTIGSYSHIRAYRVNGDNTQLNQGTPLALATPRGVTHRRPAITHQVAFDSAQSELVVYQSDVTATQADTSNTEVWGVFLQELARGPVFGQPFRLAKSNSLRDRQNVAVARGRTLGLPQTFVVWQERDHAVKGDDWDIYVQDVRSAGPYGAPVEVGSGSAHKINPKIGGGEFTTYPPRIPYLVAYEQSSSFSATIRAQRFDLKYGSNGGIVLKENRLVASGLLNQSPSLASLAMDTATQSHWALAYTRGTSEARVVRLGGSAVITESRLVESNSTGAEGLSVCSRTGLDGFVVCVGRSEAINGLYARNFAYPADAQVTSFGFGCSGAISAKNPYAGNHSFSFGVQGKSNGSGIVHVTGAASLPVPMFGSPGCFQHVSLNTLIVSIPTQTQNQFGLGTAYFPLPDDPLFIGDFFAQFMFLEGGVWKSTSALKVQVR